MPGSRRHIKRIGVTGGIGSGKSLVCEILAGVGVPVLSADDIAKDLSSTDQNLRKRIRKLLGEEAYTQDGTLNRAYIASRIFSEKRLQEKLNVIVHPAVEREIERRIDALGREGARVVVVEAALIFEAGLDKKLDAVVVVDADETKRIERVMARDGASAEEVRRRISAQWPMEKKLRKADIVIVNNGSVEELREKVLFVYNVISTMEAKE